MIPTQDNCFLIANKIYSPSYISLESALSYYGIIPEGVFIYTSITTLKTRSITTPRGTFRYSNVKPNLFFGYEWLILKDKTIKIAGLEKALCDYFYLNPEIYSIDDITGLRFSKDVLQETINKDKLEGYINIFHSGKFKKRISLLMKYIYD